MVEDVGCCAYLAMASRESVPICWLLFSKPSMWHGHHQNWAGAWGGGRRRQGGKGGRKESQEEKGEMLGSADSHLQSGDGNLSWGQPGLCEIFSSSCVYSGEQH